MRDKVRIDQLAARNVQRQHRGAAIGAAPLLKLCAPLLNDPLADLDDLSCLLSDGNEQIGSHQLAPPRPSNQCLETGQTTACKIEDGLKMEHELFSLQRAAKIIFQRMSLDDLISHGCVEDCISVATSIL